MGQNLAGHGQQERGCQTNSGCTIAHFWWLSREAPHFSAWNTVKPWNRCKFPESPAKGGVRQRGAAALRSLVGIQQWSSNAGGGLTNNTWEDQPQKWGENQSTLGYISYTLHWQWVWDKIDAAKMDTWGSWWLGIRCKDDPKATSFGWRGPSLGLIIAVFFQFWSRNSMVELKCLMVNLQFFLWGDDLSMLIWERIEISKHTRFLTWMV